MADPVCFNPDLLAGTDDAAFAYQDAVDELTDGHMPDEFDPCVDAEFVPASFVINRQYPEAPENSFNPEFTDDIQNYLKDKVYYQTRAALATWWSRDWIHADEPWPPEPANVADQATWHANPIAVIRKTASLSDQFVGAATFASLLARGRQTDRTLAAIEVYIGQVRHNAWSFAPASEFSVLHAYNLARDPELKEKLAVDLLERFEDKRSLYRDHPGVLREKVVHLWQEWAAGLVPIFITHHQDDPVGDGLLRRRFAKALVDIGNDEALGYLAERVIDDPVLDGDAFDVLLEYGRRGPDVAPYLARIFEAPQTAIETKDAILDAVAGDRVHTDPRLARAVARAIAWWVPSLEDLQKKIDYIEKSTDDPRKDLALIVTSPAIPRESEARLLAFESLLRIGTPVARRAVKGIVRGFGMDSRDDEVEKNFLKALVKSEAGAARDIVLELLDELRDRPAAWHRLAEALGSYDYLGGVEKALRFFKKAGELGHDPVRTLAREAGISMRKLAKRFSLDFAHRVRDLTPEEQLVLVEEGSLESLDDRSVAPWFYSNLKDQPLTAEARTKLEDRVLDYLSNKIFREHYVPLAYLQNETYPDALKDRLLARIAESNDGVRLIKEVASDQSLPVKIRRQAVLALGRREAPMVTIASSLVDVLMDDYVLNADFHEELRTAGIDAMEEYAERTDDRKEEVRAALKRLLPPPAALTSGARAALERIKALPHKVVR